MTTDLWYVIVDTDKKYPRLGPGKKLRRVRRMEHYALSIAIKEMADPVVQKVWDALEEKRVLQYVIDVTGLTEDEVKKVIESTWERLLERARGEMNERREM